MSKEELIEFLMENLEIEKEIEYGCYGTKDSHYIVLKLCGKEISTVNLD